MATAEECQQAFERLTARLADLDPGDRDAFFSGRSFSCQVPDLDVTFVTGRRYIYEDVPPQVSDAFRSAFSKGTFFNGEIRDRYAFREVTRKRAGPVDLFRR